MSDFSEFAAAERSGWSDPQRASGYVDLLSPASDQAIARLLDTMDSTSRLDVLDLCCGQGNVSEALVKRGCSVTGVDFSPAMLTLARSKVPQATFIEADAQALPFGDAEFDVVVSNFGICHIPDQPKALSEVRRVLRPGGRFAMTVWCGPESSPFFGAFYSAVKMHGSPAVSAPPGPDFHQFANRQTAERLMAEAGFSKPDMSVVDCVLDLERPERMFEIFERGTVRAAMLLSSQPPQSRAAIRAALVKTALEQFSAGGRFFVPVPAARLWVSTPAD